MRKTARKTKGEEGATDPKFVSVLAQLVLPLAELVRGDLRELVHTLGMQAIATMRIRCMDLGVPAGVCGAHTRVVGWLRCDQLGGGFSSGGGIVSGPSSRPSSSASSRARVASQYLGASSRCRSSGQWG